MTVKHASILFCFFFLAIAAGGAYIYSEGIEPKEYILSIADEKTVTEIERLIGTESGLYDPVSETWESDVENVPDWDDVEWNFDDLIDQNEQDEDLTLSEMQDE